MKSQIKSWSYSRYAQYKECPAKAKYKFIDKLEEPSSPALEKGNKIHKMAEAFLKGWESRVAPELSKFSDEMKLLKASKPMVEESWCFKKDWSQTKWDDWANCWLRVKVDAATLDDSMLYIIDHKTGKMREGYDEQLSLYATAGFATMPHIKTISTQLWFLDHGKAIVKEYSIEEAEELKDSWNSKVKKMLSDTVFKPKPGNHCTFCHFSKSKGGPCKY